jgi:hypothetical protein
MVGKDQGGRSQAAKNCTAGFAFYDEQSKRTNPGK